MRLRSQLPTSGSLKGTLTDQQKRPHAGYVQGLALHWYIWGECIVTTICKMQKLSAHHLHSHWKSAPPNRVLGRQYFNNGPNFSAENHWRQISSFPKKFHLYILSLWRQKKMETCCSYKDRGVVLIYTDARNALYRTVPHHFGYCTFRGKGQKVFG